MIDTAHWGEREEDSDVAIMVSNVYESRGRCVRKVYMPWFKGMDTVVNYPK